MTRAQIPSRQQITLAYAELLRLFGDRHADAAEHVLVMLTAATARGRLEAAQLAYILAWDRLWKRSLGSTDDSAGTV